MVYWLNYQIIQFASSITIFTTIVYSVPIGDLKQSDLLFLWHTYVDCRIYKNYDIMISSQLLQIQGENNSRDVFYKQLKAKNEKFRVNEIIELNIYH